MRVWGISATIGNLDQAKEVLLSPIFTFSSPIREAGRGPEESEREARCDEITATVKANIRKDVVIESIIPDEIEKYPWAGHLGLKLIHKVLPIIKWQPHHPYIYQYPGYERTSGTRLCYTPRLTWPGAIALHHGSIEQELRIWVEEASAHREAKSGGVHCQS